MEDIDGGLHPAVDGQSLDEMMRESEVGKREGGGYEERGLVYLA